MNHILFNPDRGEPWNTKDWLTNLVVSSGELRFGYQTTGKWGAWEKQSNYPILGLTLRYTDYHDLNFKNNTERRELTHYILGENIALFAYFQVPIIRYKWFSWNVSLGFGGAFSTRPYNAQNNPQNILISLYVTPYIDLQSGFSFRINDRFDLTLNGNFMHSSNATLNMPNYGINEVGALAGLRWHINPNMKIPSRKTDTAHSFQKINTLFTQVEPGFVWARYDDWYYLKTSASIGYRRHELPVLAYGAALEVIWATRLAPTKDAKAKWIDANPDGKPIQYVADLPANIYNLALYTFGEATFGRFIFHIGLGYYFLKGPGEASHHDLAQTSDFGNHPANLSKNPTLYQKVGFKFELGNDRRHFVGIALRGIAIAGAFPVADYLSIQYGYKFHQFGDVKRKM
jgi:hypothetical protein